MKVSFTFLVVYFGHERVQSCFDPYQRGPEQGKPIDSCMHGNQTGNYTNIVT